MAKITPTPRAGVLLELDISGVTFPPTPRAGVLLELTPYGLIPPLPAGFRNLGLTRGARSVT